ncbi:hypothetical protein D3880_05430 [Pseudomonas cavernae]|uniref:Transmembrane protein n=1 Tax=Pseudomonas cavernae TaxID=2320867 RepID=A0A385YYK9_9PSED|nr:hypothetical protein [Pseudomonas cavernae]AYC31856.1 hypothetical protein D3880_05430 [Pseudomonas cavernae]
MSTSASVAIRHYALAGVLAVVLLNLLLRSFVRLGGVAASLCIAALVAAGLALCFALRVKRAPLAGERWRLLGLYGGGLGLLYLGLLVMMSLQDAPSPMGLLLFGLHYLLYPLCLWLLFSPRLFARFGS